MKLKIPKFKLSRPRFLTDDLITELKAQLLGNFFSLVFGILITIIFFSITRPSNEPEELKNRLNEILKDELEFASTDIIQELSTHTYENGVTQIKTILYSVKQLNSNNECIKNHIGIFEPKEENLIDRIVGRQSAFVLNSISSFSCNHKVTEDELIDFDTDGQNEIHLRLQASYADRTSFGPLIYKRINRKWEPLYIPSMTDIVNDRNAGIPPIEVASAVGSNGAIRVFVKDSSLSLVDTLKRVLKNPTFYEDDIGLIHNKKDFKFTTFANGGNYSIMKHPIKKYYHVGILNLFNDGYSVLDDHFGMVQFFKFDQKELVVDELWNWGYPIYSGYKIDLSIFEFEEMQKAGMEPHISNDKFFGYFDFQKVN